MTTIPCQTASRQFLDHFEKVTKAGKPDQYSARCPAHEDHKASLSIKRGPDRWLVKCFGGCTPEAIVAAIDLTLADLFFDVKHPPTPKSKKPQPPDNSAEVPKVVTEYSYVDENGKLFYQNVRFEPKNFRVRRPGPPGPWVWSLEGVRRVLYKLPQVLAADEVLVVAGEKDADRAEKLGFVATTNVFGENVEWLPGYSESLRGKRVILIPDNDDTGIKHVRKVARATLGIASSVKLLKPLPGVGPKGDLSDFADKVGDEAAAIALRALIDDEPELTADDFKQWEEEAKKARRPFPALTVSEFLEKKLRPLTPLIGNILHAQEVVALVARRRNGKTTLLTDMLMTAADGEPDWLGFEIPSPVSSLYVYLDDAPGLVQDHVRQRVQRRPHDRFRILTRDEFRLTGWSIRPQDPPTDFMIRLRDTVEEFRPQILVLDNAALMLEGDYNNSARVMALVNYAIDLAADFQCSVIIPVHPRKHPRGKDAQKVSLAQDAELFFEEVMGSSVIINHAPNLWGIERDYMTGLTTARFGAQRTTGEDSLMYLAFEEDSQRFRVLFGPENMTLLLKTHKRQLAWNALPDSFSFEQGAELVAKVAQMARSTYANFLAESRRLGLMTHQDRFGTYAKTQLGG
jgi:hypothetical protein